MLNAEPSPAYRRFFTWYFRRRMCGAFAAVYAEGLEHLEPWRSHTGRADHPLMIVANHSSWWDAVLPIVISLGRLEHDAYGIMEGRQLERYGFFRRIGMFSIDRDDPRSAMRSLGYGADLLRDTRRVLWMFPQGEIVPNDRRPIGCYSGAGRLARMTGRCSIVPVAFRYELAGEERPVAWVSVGEVTTLDASGHSPAELTDMICRLLTTRTDHLRDAVINGHTQNFQRILSGKRSIDTWWDEVRGKV